MNCSLLKYIRAEHVLHIQGKYIAGHCLPRLLVYSLLADGLGGPACSSTTWMAMHLNGRHVILNFSLSLDTAFTIENSYSAKGREDNPFSKGCLQDTTHLKVKKTTAIIYINQLSH